MEKNFLKVSLKYLYFFLADATIFFGVIITSLLLADVRYSEFFSYAEIYIMFGIPIYLILRGIISCVVFRKVWIPNLVFLIEIWILLPIISGEFSFSILFSASGIILAIIFFLISTVASLIAYGIIKSIKLFEKD